MTKPIEFWTENDVLYSNNNYLKGVFNVTPEDKEQGYIADLWYDCDHVKVDGEQGRGNVCFVVHENKSKMYVILERGDYETETDYINLIEWFLSGADGEIGIENNWNDWDNVQTGVAFRGGSGYCYALYAKTLKNT